MRLLSRIAARSIYTRADSRTGFSRLRSVPDSSSAITERVAANRRRYALSGAAESQQQLCESEDYVARALARARPRSRRNRLIAIEHRVERNRRLDPCQRRTQAVVDSAAECEMAGPIALDVELLRVRKYCGIAVGGSECDRHGGMRSFFRLELFSI